ncbi:MAG: hypothetical protein AAF501_05530 [Pseudomonadota bacterium]
MTYLASVQNSGASQLIGLIGVKLVALMVVIALSEERGRELMPLIGVTYAVILPIILWLIGP